MTTRRICLAVLGIALFATAPLLAQPNLGRIFFNRNDFTTLIRAAEVAGVPTEWKHGEYYTIFAPSNAAFALLPPGTVDTLMLPANHEKLNNLLRYHVVMERITYDDLKQRIAAGGGTTTLTTIHGKTLVATMQDGSIVLQDLNGGVARISTTDIRYDDGVVYSIDHVLMP